MTPHAQNGITKADREARKSDDLLKRDFKADKPFSKCVTDITEVKAKETLNKTKSTRSHEYTHRSDFVTLRFIQRIPWKRNAGVLYVRQVSLTKIAVQDFCKDFLNLNGY